VPSTLDKLLLKVGKLPTMPHVASKILELVSNPETSAKQLQLVIDSDQVLAMRILKVANSALYALPRKIKTLQQAIVMLGFNHIRSLVLAEAIQNLFKGKGKKGSLLESLLWEHSVGAAMGSKVVAQTLRIPHPEEAFVASLIHDVGKLILLQGDPDGYQEIIEAVYNDYQPFSELEMEKFGVEHAEVGAALAKKWNLHEKLGEAIGAHHSEEADGEVLNDLVRLGNAIAWKCEWGFRREPDFDISSYLPAQRLNLGEEKVEGILETTREMMQAERKTFNITTSAPEHSDK
jgi:putative nucleotidyltransferase with HDIG domain